MSKARRTFMGDFRTFFVRGLAILLPSIITLALLVWSYGFLKTNIAEPINGGVRGAVLAVGPNLVGAEALGEWYEVTDAEKAAMQNATPRELDEQALVAAVRRDSLRESWTSRWYLQAIGFVVAVVLVYLAGVLVGNFLGRRLYQRFESWAIRLPVIKQVYPNVKQVTDFLLGEGEGKSAFPSNRVVLVEYPRKGIWTVGLLTGETLRAIEAIVGKPCVTVFIPSSPTPFTGYTITVPQDEVHDLPLSLDEAIRFVVSGGVLVPPRQRVGGSREIVRPPDPGGGDLASGPGGAMMQADGASGGGRAGPGV